MPHLILTAVTVPGPGRAIVRITDQTDWAQAPNPRESYAIFLTGSRIGSVVSQTSELPAFSYNAQLFRSAANPPGTVEVAVAFDGVLRLQAIAVLVVADEVALAAAAAGIYYQEDVDQFYSKNVQGTIALVSSWEDLLQLGEVDDATEVYAFNKSGLETALATLNLRYLEAGNRVRRVLVEHYVLTDLLVDGARRQFERGFYADAATTILAAERLVGPCLPDFEASLPALAAN